MILFDGGPLPKTREAAIDAYALFIETAAATGASLEYEKAIAAGADEEQAVACAMRGQQTGQDFAQRTLCKADLFYLLVFALGRTDINRDWLFDRCREVQAENNNTLDLWARFHFKSSIITFGLTIQEILCDPEITICIFSDINKVAKPFLGQIKRELEDNTLLKRLFPDVLYEKPETESPKWSEQDGIVVKRKGNPKEATVEAYGLIDGMPTGRHFVLRIYDDLVTVNSVTSEDMMRKVADRLALSHALGVEVGGRVRYIGTRYHALDAYQGLIDKGRVWVRLHPATVDGKPESPPVLLTPSYLSELRTDMGPFQFAAQMLQDPTADKAQGFVTEWLRYWPADNRRNLNIYILVDPSSGRKGRGRGTTSRAGGGDFSAYWVVGAGADRHYYVLDHVRDRLSLTQRANLLFELVREYQPLAVGYEEYGMQADIDHILAEQARQNVRFTVVPLGGQIAKVDRIRRLIPTFEAGRILLPSSLIRITRDGRSYAPIRDFVEQEYRNFPLAAHDDSLDALARIHDEDLGIIWPQMVVNDGRPNATALPIEVIRRAQRRAQVVDWRQG